MSYPDELKEFWETLKAEAEIKFRDIEHLELLLSRVFQRMEELETSRDSWREKAKGYKEQLEIFRKV